MQWLRTLPTTDGVRDLVRDAYDVDVLDCVLVRSFVNDVYLVETGNRRMALKVYRRGWRSVADVAWEQELTGHCIGQGLAVAAPIPLADGRLVGEVPYPEGARAFAMSKWIDGRKPQPPFTAELYRQFGILVARFHAASDRFVGAGPARQLDPLSYLGEPLREVLAHDTLTAADRDLLAALATAARHRITDWAATNPARGICHGDVSLDNIYLTDGGLALYDFDLAGESWRLGDFLGVHSTPHWNAFANGYAAESGHGVSDEHMVPWLQVPGRIGNLRFHLVQKPETRGTESLTEGWVERELEALRALGGTLLRC